MDYHSSGPNTTPAQSKNQMSHSVSSPSNMDNPAEEGVPQSQNVLEVKKTPSKMFSVQVHFLDGTIGNVQIQYKALGNLLFEQVCKMLNLLEVDYFGLEYSDEAGVKYWLDYDKPMCRQLGLSMVHPVMYFSIKFYTPDPAQLEEEYTRYLFSLQIKRDLAQGLLQCNENTAALMASYIVQSECGDYNLEDYPDHLYLSSYKFVPNQDTDFQRKIMENHKKHVGQTPSEADLNLLETSRRCELYGIRMTPAKDNEGVPLNLATAHMGVLVFQNYTKINTFSWAKIRKLSFKRKRFLIKLHPEGYGFYKDSVDFNFESRNECKNFWKKCIENHAFFRCAEVKKVPRQKTRIFSRGSSFRYSGRTQKQIVEFVRENYIKRQPFQRSTSLRIPSSSRSGVGTSISAQPLLPVSGSQSCGSVIISSENASSNRPSSPSHSPPRPPLHQNANSVSQPVSPTHHHMTNGGSAISNERDPSRTSPDGNGGQSRGGHKSDREDDSLPPGLKSSDLESSFDDGLKSPDFLGQETEDNVSHDSYLVDEKDVSAADIADLLDDDSLIIDNTDSVLEAVLAQAETFLSERVGEEIVIDNIESTVDEPVILSERKEKVRESPNLKRLETEEVEGKGATRKKMGQKDKSKKSSNAGKIANQPDVVPILPDRSENFNGEIEYILHKRLFTTKIGPDNERKKRKPRVRVEMERPRTTHGSPTLYARASRVSSSFSMGDEMSACNGKLKGRRGSSASPKGHRLRTVDYVSVHQLPAMRSFSSQDDSLEDDSFEKDVFEQFRRRRLSQGNSEKKELKISQSKSDDSILKNSCANFPYIDDDTGRGDLNYHTEDGRTSPETVKAGFNMVETVQMVPDCYESFGDFPRASSPVGFDAQDEGIECELDGIIFISDRPESVVSNDDMLPDILPALLLPPPSPPLAFQTKDLTCDIYQNPIPLSPPSNISDQQLYDVPDVMPKFKSQKCLEEDILSQCSSSGGSAGTFSQDSSGSDQMRQLSDTQLFETHLVLSQEDLATFDDDFPIDQFPINHAEVTHTEEIYITLNSQNSENQISRPAARYSYSAYKYNSFDDGSTTTEGETICDDTSLNEQMEVLEHITEQFERSYSDDETAIVGEDPSTESLPTTPRSTRSHRSYLELEVIGGAILERTSSFSHCSPTHSTTPN